MGQKEPCFTIEVEELCGWRNGYEEGKTLPKKASRKTCAFRDSHPAHIDRWFRCDVVHRDVTSHACGRTDGTYGTGSADGFLARGSERETIRAGVGGTALAFLGQALGQCTLVRAGDSLHHHPGSG